eukprot:1643712-Pyramimonas_sp.AAC.1
MVVALLAVGVSRAVFSLALLMDVTLTVQTFILMPSGPGDAVGPVEGVDAIVDSGVGDGDAETASLQVETASRLELGFQAVEDVETASR